MMMFADFLGELAFGFLAFLFMIGWIANKVFSGIGSFFQSDVGQEVAKEFTKGAIEGFFENLFGD